MADLRERKRAAVMTHIQDVALQLFTRHGSVAVTIADVAAEAGVAERTVYRHFGTKQANSPRHTVCSPRPGSSWPT